MDGENHGKPYEQMDDLGDFPIFLGWHPYGTNNNLSTWPTNGSKRPSLAAWVRSVPNFNLSRYSKRRWGYQMHKSDIKWPFLHWGSTSEWGPPHLQLKPFLQHSKEPWLAGSLLYFAAISRNLLGNAKLATQKKDIAKRCPRWLRPCRPSHYTLRCWELPWSVREAPAIPTGSTTVPPSFHSDLHSIGTQDDLKAIGCKDFAKELTAIAVFLVKQHETWSNVA